MGLKAGTLVRDGLRRNSMKKEWMSPFHAAIYPVRIYPVFWLLEKPVRVEEESTEE